jgi:phosphatidylglycerol:prolipoprotein diacylglycerol transferase
MNFLLANAPHWTGNVNNVAFTVFGRPVAWYGIIITSAMILGLVLAILRGKRQGLKADDWLEMFLIIAPMSIIFARLGFLLANPAAWSRWYAVYEGGLTITFGVPGGVLGCFIWCKWRKADFMAVVDRAAPTVLACQALGKWGNFFNQELYGLAVTNPSAQWFPLSVYIRGSGWHQAAFFYEAVCCLVMLAVILFIQKRLRIKGAGVFLYFGAYALIRFCMEFTRMDMHGLKSGVNVLQILCALVCVAMVGILVFLGLRAKKKGEQVWYKKGIPDDKVFQAKYKPSEIINGASNK